MSIAFVGVLPETIFAAKNTKRSRSVGDRNLWLARHAYGGLLVMLLAVGGGGMIVASKWVRGKRHFSSLHGLVGVTCLSAVWVQCIVGIVLYYRPAALRTLLGRCRYIHRCCGVVVLVTSCFAMSLGLFTHFATEILHLHPFLHGVLSCAAAAFCAWAFLHE